MSFKLSQQLDSGANPNLLFEVYDSYIANNKNKFPQSAINVISNPDWSGGSQSKAPYYSQLNAVEIENIGKPDASLKLILRKDMYVEKPFNIEISYAGILKLDFPNQDNISHSNMTWRYEQFLYLDGYQSHKLKDKLFTHQIEWVGGEVWSITAREIHVKWSSL